MKTSSTNELVGNSSFNSFLTNMQANVDSYPPKKLDHDVFETARLIKVSKITCKAVTYVEISCYYMGQILF